MFNPPTQTPELLVRLQVLQRACHSLNFIKKSQQQLFPSSKSFFLWCAALPYKVSPPVSWHVFKLPWNSRCRLLWTIFTAWLEDVSACAVQFSSRSLATGFLMALPFPFSPRRNARSQLDINQVLYGTKDVPGPLLSTSCLEPSGQARPKPSYSIDHHPLCHFISLRRHHCLTRPLTKSLMGQPRGRQQLRFCRRHRAGRSI